MTKKRAPSLRNWQKHREYETDPYPELPTPRLEIRWVDQEADVDGYTVRAEYSLVYRHFLGQTVFVPLGITRSTGTAADRAKWEEVDLPFRDGCHFANEANQLRLPAFAIAADKVTRFVPCARCGRLERWHRNGIECVYEARR
jgi:hypothetical protein